MNNFTDYELGEKPSKLLKIQSRQENADATLAFAKQCKLKLAVISNNLDPFIYEQSEFVEAVRQLILNSRHAAIRIMVFEPESVIHRGHKLLDLAGRISSFIEMRKPSLEHNAFNKAVMIADNVGYLLRNNSERYDGTVNFNDRRESKYLLDVFNSMWESAKPDPNLRRINL